MKSILIKIVLTIVFLGIGLGVGIGYGRYQLNRAEEAHALAVEKMERKIAQWQKKYNERNARIEIERRNVKRLRNEMTELQEQVAGLQISEAVKLKKLKARINMLKEELASMEYQHLKLQAGEEHLTAELDTTKTDLGQMTVVAEELKKKSAELDFALRKKSSDYDRCFKHNQQMAEAAGELLVRYQNKTPWKSISEVEPLTGIGKVELEHIVQEYGFRIEDHRLEK